MFLDQLLHIIVFVAEAHLLTPVDLFCLSAWLVSSRSFWEPVASLFVSEMHVAPVVEACTLVHGRMWGVCWFSGAFEGNPTDGEEADDALTA